MGLGGWNVNEHVEFGDESLKRRLHKQFDERDQDKVPLLGVVDQSSTFEGGELHIRRQFAWCEG